MYTSCALLYVRHTARYREYKKRILHWCELQVTIYFVTRWTLLKGCHGRVIMVGEISLRKHNVQPMSSRSNTDVPDMCKHGGRLFLLTISCRLKARLTLRRASPRSACSLLLYIRSRVLFRARTRDVVFSSPFAIFLLPPFLSSREGSEFW